MLAVSVEKLSGSAGTVLDCVVRVMFLLCALLPWQSSCAHLVQALVQRPGLWGFTDSSWCLHGVLWATMPWSTDK